jgi:beta-N-acetylhexosaminidase
MQMLLNKGKYGNETFLQAETIDTFAKLYDLPNHRGLGWDKAPADPAESNYVAAAASRSSFGHSGFTGTMVWADPENELVFVFLSNRVNPNAENNVLNKAKIRKEIHQAVYDAIEK